MYTRPWDHMAGKHSEDMIRRDEDSAIIPFDDGNRDYQEYLAWLDDDNEPASDPVPPEPETPPITYEEALQQLEDLEERVVALEQVNEANSNQLQALQREIGAKNGDASKA